MIVQLIVDFLPWPKSKEGGLADRIVERIDSGSILTSAPEAITRALNERGWLDQEVLAAGELRQGKEPSLFGMVTGLALVELYGPRRSKVLPRHFVLAVTADRVVAFTARGGADGEDGDGTYRLWIRPGVRASWPLESVRLVDFSEGSGSSGGSLVLDGIERIPVYRPNPDADPSTDELLGVLAG
jgi:hypothetical protein